MNKLNVSQICAALVSLSEQDLMTVNAEAVALLRHKSKLKQMQAGASFNLKDVVEFTDRYERTVRGVVEKINPKSVRVRTETGLWNVSPTLLKKVS